MDVNIVQSGGSISKEQKRTMIEFLKKNPKLLSGKFSMEFTLKTATLKWQELTEILNAIPGAKKNWRNWRKTWHDLRSRTKSKKCKITNHSGGTGGGPASEDTLSNDDNEIIELICPVALEGHRDVEESLVEMDIPLASEEAIPTINQNENIVAMDSQVIPEETPVRPKRRRGIERLEKSITATNKLAEQLDSKIKIKKEYYEKKLELLERKVVAIERMATAKEKIARILQGDSYMFEVDV